MENKIHNYDFLIVGAGLIGCLAALELIKKNFKVLVIDKSVKQLEDNRTLAVNANSTEFLNGLGLWKNLQNKSEPIKKIFISDYINTKKITFDHKPEFMGNVIFNKDLLTKARKILKSKKSILLNIDLPISALKKENLVCIKNKFYVFKKIILSAGKNFDNAVIHKKSFNQGHQAYVGFFKHSKNHNNYAYEVFTNTGPLAVLPAPNKDKLFSTFIYSSKIKISSNDLKNLIRKNFKNSHGLINFEKKINFFKLNPHLSYPINNNFLILGDNLRSIHPVAGQGWNLGIKDIQTLSNVLDKYSLDDSFLEQIYFSRRNIESALYLKFTSFLNFLYEEENSIKKNIVRLGFKFLNIPPIKNLFIRQAMGRDKLI